MALHARVSLLAAGMAAAACGGARWTATDAGPAGPPAGADAPPGRACDGRPDGARCDLCGACRGGACVAAEDDDACGVVCPPAGPCRESHLVAGRCAGRGACRTAEDCAEALLPAGTACAPASCADGMRAAEAMCDGAGLCVRPAPEPCPADAPWCEAGACSPCRRPEWVAIDAGPSARAFGIARDDAGRLHALYTSGADGEPAAARYAVCEGDCLDASAWTVVPVPGVAEDAGGRAFWAADGAGAVRVTGASGAYAECDADCGRPESWSSATLDFLAGETAAVALAAGRTHLFWVGEICSDEHALHSRCDGDCTDAARWSPPGRGDERRPPDCSVTIEDAGVDPTGGVYALYFDSGCYDDSLAHVARCPAGEACDDVEGLAPDDCGSAWIVEESEPRLASRQVIAVAPGPDGGLHWLGEHVHHAPWEDCGWEEPEVRLLGPRGGETIAYLGMDLAAPVVEDGGGVTLVASLRQDLLRASGPAEVGGDWTWEPLQGLRGQAGRRVATDERGLHVLVAGEGLLRYARVPHATLCGCGVRTGGRQDWDRRFRFDQPPEVVAVAPDRTFHAFERAYHWNDDDGGSEISPWSGDPVTVAFGEGGDVHVLVDDPREEIIRYFRCAGLCGRWTLAEVSLGEGQPRALAVVGDTVHAIDGDDLYRCAGECGLASSWSSAPAPILGTATLGRAGDALAAAQVRGGVLEIGLCDDDCLDPDRWRFTAAADPWSEDVPAITARGEELYLLAGDRLAACPGRCDEPKSWTSLAVPGAAPPLAVAPDGALVAGGQRFASCDRECHLPESWRAGVLPLPVTALAPGENGGSWRTIDFHGHECDDDRVDTWYSSARVTCLP